jgi:hypothetical protein
MALAILALLFLAAGALVGLWRYMGWGAGPFGPLRHAFAEAGLRLRRGA